MRVSFLAVGDELLTGESREGNAAALAERLGAYGLRLSEVRVVGDDEDAIVRALGDLCARGSAVVVLSGGLGPTDDDLTRAAVARFARVALSTRAEALAQIEARFAHLGRRMHPSNRRQAELPDGAALAENRHGSAPGFIVDVGGSCLCAFPGVPREFAGMVDDHLAGIVARHGGAGAASREITYRLFGISESDMQGVLHTLPHYGAARMRSLPSWPEIRLKLSSRGDDAAFGRLLDEVRDHLGRYVYGQGDGDSHPAAVLRALQARGATLAIAESCTGGLIGSLVTDVAGASRTLLLGVVAYSNAAKSSQIDVPPAVVAQFGAVSEQVARAMAEGVRARAGADVAVATTGVAGPDGGTIDKPVGTLCVAVADGRAARSERLQFGGLGRARFKSIAAHVALDRLRQWAIGAP